MPERMLDAVWYLVIATTLSTDLMSQIPGFGQGTGVVSPAMDSPGTADPAMLVLWKYGYLVGGDVEPACSSARCSGVYISLQLVQMFQPRQNHLLARLLDLAR